MSANDNEAPQTLLNAPNLVTLSRVVFGVVAIFCLVSHDQGLMIAGVALMALAELTDFLDGYVARLTRQVTDMGKVLDPMADSMYRLMIFGAFVQAGWMGAWLLAVFVVRDIGVSYARMIAMQNGRPVSARFSGKLKAVVQGIAQIYVAAVMALHLDNLAPLCAPLLYIAAAVTFYSLVDYVMALTGRPSSSKLAKR
jgi:CDP-diacylglycerol--glycerol-3-phosphate 3-phosphatidyltransferase